MEELERLMKEKEMARFYNIFSGEENKHIFGMYDAINQFVDYINKGLNECPKDPQERMRYIFIGEPGSGRSWIEELYQSGDKETREIFEKVVKKLYEATKKE